jgi:asparagine synthase (glutamine-hydrolysing)
MLFGLLSPQKIGDDNKNILRNLNKNLRWSGSKLYKITWRTVEVRILEDEKKSFKLEDYLYVDDVNEVLIIFEGYIYNQNLLSDKFILPEIVHNTPEFIYQMISREGISCLSEFNGEFSIIYYNHKLDTVYFIRDHLGIRPLALSIIRNNIYFSTDPMGMCQVLYKHEILNQNFFLNYFLKGKYKYGLLPNNKVINVKPGNFFEINSDRQIGHSYWFPEKISIDYSLTQRQLISELSEILYDAVKIRSDKRFRASAHVSGGIDSGVVAALARKEYKDQNEFYGFSWSPDFKTETDKITHDERFLVEKTCKMNNIIPVYFNLTTTNYLNFFSDWRHPSEMMYEHKIIQKAKEKGVNLLFSGWGGDEFISIGHRGIDADLFREFDWYYFLKKYPLWRLKRFISALLFSALFPGIRRTYSKYKAEPSVYPYIKNSIGSNIIPRKERFRYHSRREVHLQLLKMGHLSQRASDWYVHGQRNGVEYRYPLLDKRIVEYMLKVPSKCLVGGINYRIILREIGKDLLPEEVLMNKSKDDPVKNKQFYSIIYEFRKKFISELPDYRNNPDLAFVDFNLLEKNLPKILDAIEKGQEDDGSSIFYYLKTAHEFTKGYYDKT